MAAPLIISGAAIAGGFVAADLTAPSVGTTQSLFVYVGGAVVVALIGAAVQLWNNRQANKGDPKLTPITRLDVLEEQVADLRADVREILDHVRPWPTEQSDQHERHRR